MTPGTFLVYADLVWEKSNDRFGRRKVRGVTFAKYCTSDDLLRTLKEAAASGVTVAISAVRVDDAAQLAMRLHGWTPTPTHRRDALTGETEPIAGREFG